MDKKEISRLLKVCNLLDLDNNKDIKNIETGVNKFFANDYFKEEFAQCPNDLLKCYYVLNYATSAGCAKYDKAEASVKKQFTKYEWQHLIDHTPNVTAKICYSKMLDKA